MSATQPAPRERTLRVAGHGAHDGEHTAELVQRDRRGYPELRRYLSQLHRQGCPVTAMLRDVPSHRLTEVAHPARYVRTVVGNHSADTPAAADRARSGSDGSPRSGRTERGDRGHGDGLRNVARTCAVPAGVHRRGAAGDPDARAPSGDPDHRGRTIRRPTRCVCWNATPGGAHVPVRPCDRPAARYSRLRRLLADDAGMSTVEYSTDG